MRARMLTLAIVSLLALLPAAAAAETSKATTPETLPLAELEKAFWYCDFVATTQGMRAVGPIAACSVVVERLKKEKFGENYEEYLAWWRRNKPAEHGKLYAASRAEALL